MDNGRTDVRSASIMPPLPVVGGGIKTLATCMDIWILRSYYYVQFIGVARVYDGQIRCI